jgi:hypothetical protein
MSETWRQVVEEADPSAMKPPDVANLGAPPRDLTPAMLALVKQIKPSFTVLLAVVAVFSLAGSAILIAIVGLSSEVLVGLWFPALMIGLAIWSARRSRQRRAPLLATLRDGPLRFARLVENRQIAIGQGMGKRYRYHAAFNVDGRRVPFVIINDAMGMLQPGQLVEVVHHHAHPDEIVPTFLLA